MDQLAAVRAFLRIVETHSLSKAAAHLDMPRSTVSKALADLEAHLGARLLQRTTRAVSLTMEGAEYYRRVNRLIAKIDEADTALRSMGATAKGRLRIDCYSSMANLILIPALDRFHAEHPDIQLLVGINDRPVNLIEEGVDCVVRAGALSDTSLIARTILKDQLVTCASPQYLARHGVPATPEALESEHWIVGYFGGVNGEPWPLSFKGKYGSRRISRFNLASNDSIGAINMMTAGLGIGQTHLSVVKSHLAANTLVRVLDEYTKKTIPVSVIYPPNKQLSSRLRVFIDWLAKNIYNGQ